MPQLNGNTYEALSGPSELTIEGVKYDVRTRVVYNNSGRTGTIDSEKPIQYEFQYRQKPDIGNPAPSWTPLATRSTDKSKNNGWVFTQAAGPGFKKELVKPGPNTLTTSMDSAAQNALAKDANVPVARAQQAIGAAPNKALPTVAADQNPNAASGGPNQAQAAAQGGTLTPEQAQESIKDLTSKETESLSRSKFPQNLRYPANLQINQQDVIKFNMVKYSPRKFKSGEGTINPIQERRKITDELIIGSVYLPIPGGITDTNAVTWGSDSMDPIQSALANIAMQAIGGGGEPAANSTAGTVTDISQNSTDAKSWVKSYFAQAATGTTNLLSRTQGAVTNPNMELLFTGPTLRPFTFTFKLSARGKADREQIRQIIRFFKQGMAVQRTQSQLFLKAPHTFKIQYLHREKDHQYINKIKECALQSFTVNYTPEGNYMTFADGLMTSYEITMQFQELEPIFNDDYGNIDGNAIDSEIGY
jgi:hypothetical protein